MRHLLILLCLLAAPLAAWGCEPAETVPMSMTGIVQPLGPSFYMQGSHKLVDDEGKVVALLSDRETNLDAFVGQRVRVQGPMEPTVEGNLLLVLVRAVQQAP